jgi:predicted nucleotide-binding protein
MTTNRTESSGLLPPQKAIEELENCSNVGRAALASASLTENERVAWRDFAAHVIERTHGPDSPALTDFLERGLLGCRPNLAHAFIQTRGRQALTRQVDFVATLAKNLRFDVEHSVTPPPASVPVAPTPTAAPPNNKVFVVHGHDHGAKSAVARCIETLELDAVVLHEQPNGGRTVVEKLEAFGDVGFAVALLTPDDLGALKGAPSEQRPRARQNVILELGYFVGRIGRPKVCVLLFDGIELPSDLQGIVHERYDRDDGAWRMWLAQELHAAGLPANLLALFRR